MSPSQEIRVLDLVRNVVQKNDEIACGLRQRFKEAGLFALNLLSGPGAGKTTLLERTLQGLGVGRRCLVIEGDLRTARDAQRIAAAGGRAVQIVTNGTCHLESRMIVSALEGVDLRDLDAIVIENVGNLVCPSGFDLGESARAVMASSPEGEDKPEKYPFMFEKAEVVILNKVDLLPHLAFDKEAFWAAVARLNPAAERMEISCASGAGIDRWLGWLARRIEESKTNASGLGSGA
ncbi:MAG: hydrogenase nickel incorporation protein HypB [Candidatus Eisenbacteria bacterium]|nr:hydrogenase nickel incorporation protein HypB [Candidatus Eisenbacteria bacterium]